MKYANNFWELINKWSLIFVRVSKTANILKCKVLVELEYQKNKKHAETILKTENNTFKSKNLNRQVQKDTNKKSIISAFLLIIVVKPPEAVVQGCSVKKGVLRNFAKFTWKHPC